MHLCHLPSHFRATTVHAHYAPPLPPPPSPPLSLSNEWRGEEGGGSELDGTAEEEEATGVCCPRRKENDEDEKRVAFAPSIMRWQGGAEADWSNRNSSSSSTDLSC